MNNQRLTLLAMALSSTLSAGVAFSQTAVLHANTGLVNTTDANSSLSAHDRKFVDTAGEAGAAEVAMGRLAESHSNSADVKGLAARVVSDHQKAGDELKSIAQAKGVTREARLSTKDQADLDKLSKLQGADFDKAYIQSQLAAHKSAVSLFGSESKFGKDPELKQFASTTLPTLEDHLQMVRQLSKATKS